MKEFIDHISKRKKLGEYSMRGEVTGTHVESQTIITAPTRQFTTTT